MVGNVYGEGTPAIPIPSGSLIALAAMGWFAEGRLSALTGEKRTLEPPDTDLQSQSATNGNAPNTRTMAKSTHCLLRAKTSKSQPTKMSIAGCYMTWHERQRQDGGGFLPDRFWTAKLGKRPSRWPPHFDRLAPQICQWLGLCKGPLADICLYYRPTNALLTLSTLGARVLSCAPKRPRLAY